VAELNSKTRVNAKMNARISESVNVCCPKSKQKLTSKKKKKKKIWRMRKRIRGNAKTNARMNETSEPQT
jgi:hypothetical protein